LICSPDIGEAEPEPTKGGAVLLIEPDLAWVAIADDPVSANESSIIATNGVLPIDDPSLPLQIRVACLRVNFTAAPL
jgi:hypothetical protein